MVGRNDDVINAVYQWLIQMAWRDFESMPVLKKGGGNRKVVVAVKRKELQAIFRGKVVSANCALLNREIRVDLSIEVPQNKHHIASRDGNDQVWKHVIKLIFGNVIGIDGNVGIGNNHPQMETLL